MAARIPPHKAVPGTRFAVDCFRLRGTGASAFFLTHGHSDHYGGLDARWDEGPVYCSELTSRLVPLRTGVSQTWLRVLPLNQPVKVDGVTVVAVDANHCPGAVMLLFARRRATHPCPSAAPTPAWPPPRSPPPPWSPRCVHVEGSE